MTHHDVTHAPKMYTSAVPPFLCVSLHTGRPPLPSSNTTLPGMENAALASWTMRSLSAEARGTTRVAARARLVATRLGARRVGASAWRDPRDMARDMARVVAPRWTEDRHPRWTIVKIVSHKRKTQPTTHAKLFKHTRSSRNRLNEFHSHRGNSWTIT